MFPYHVLSDAFIEITNAQNPNKVKSHITDIRQSLCVLPQYFWKQHFWQQQETDQKHPSLWLPSEKKELRNLNNFIINEMFTFVWLTHMSDVHYKMSKKYIVIQTMIAKLPKEHTCNYAILYVFFTISSDKHDKYNTVTVLNTCTSITKMHAICHICTILLWHIDLYYTPIILFMASNLRLSLLLSSICLRSSCLKQMNIHWTSIKTQRIIYFSISPKIKKNNSS